MFKYRKQGHTGLFDKEFTTATLSKIGNPLESLSAALSKAKTKVLKIFWDFRVVIKSLMPVLFGFLKINQ